MSRQDSDIAQANSPLLRYFRYDHLPVNLQGASKPYFILAKMICEEFEPSEERTMALRKLLESKDCSVRCKVDELQRMKTEVKNYD